MKKITALIMAMLLMLAFVGCGSEPATSEESELADAKEETVIEESVSQYPLTLTDKFGNEIVIESAPETIISMSPEVTEIIYGLGAGETLIGRSKYCNYPEETANVADYGSLFDLNVESIVAAQPDIIFLSSMASEELVDNLMAQSLTVVTYDKDSSLDGTYVYINEIGKIIDKVNEAAVMVEDLQKRITAVEEKVADLEAPTVYYVVYAGDGYDSTATGDTFIHDMIVTSGGDNVAADGTDWSYNIETLIEKDPYIMFCGAHDGSKERIEGLEGYKDLTAIVEGRLYEVEADIFSRQGPRVAEAVETMAAVLHPEVFAE